MSKYFPLLLLIAFLFACSKKETMDSTVPDTTVTTKEIVYGFEKTPLW